jgi:hypothetical protein
MVFRPGWYAGCDTDERDGYHREEKRTFHVRMPPIKHFTYYFFHLERQRLVDV